MIKIEIISVQPQSITAAFYYPVPQSVYSSASVDPSRIPAGNGLSAQELQDLKDGKLWELVRDVDPESKTQVEMRLRIERMWDELKGPAKQDYIQKFSYTNMSSAVGKVWDGNTWS